MLFVKYDFIIGCLANVNIKLCIILKEISIDPMAIFNKGTTLLFLRKVILWVHMYGLPPSKLPCR